MLCVVFVQCSIELMQYKSATPMLLHSSTSLWLISILCNFYITNNHLLAKVPPPGDLGALLHHFISTAATGKGVWLGPEGETHTHDVSHGIF